MLRRLLRRYGVFASTAVLTAASIMISVVVTAAVNLWNDGSIGATGMMVAVIVPAVTASIFGGLTLRLADQLDRAQDQLRKLSITDDLTQAYNRRYFFEVAGQELARATRTGEVFSIVILDMDDFKQINDAYGHRVGDSVLRAVSTLCMATVRVMDTFARYGGEEFVFLLPHMKGDDALKFCARIQRALTESHVVEDGHKVSFSASIGVATFDSNVTDVYGLITKADRALYAAKSRGKNIIMASTEAS